MMTEEVQKTVMIEIFKKFTPEEQDVILKYHQMIAHVTVAGATIIKVMDEADLINNGNINERERFLD